MAIQNIVFDIGGVLADYNVKGFLSDKGFDSAMIKRILKASVMSPYWGQFERAESTEEETLKGFVSIDPEIEKELYAAFSSVEGMLTICDDAISLVKGLKKAGYRVFYLSRIISSKDNISSIGRLSSKYTTTRHAPQSYVDL